MDPTSNPRPQGGALGSSTGQSPLSNLNSLRGKSPAGSEEYLFFNVMPKVQGGEGNMVKPTLKVIQPEEPKPSGNKNITELIKKYRLYLIIGGVVIILAIITYFVFGVFGAPKSDNFLPSKSSAKPAAGAAAATQSSSTPLSIDQWRQNYFGANCDPVVCSDEADPDHDGLINKQEYALKTDPNNADSDQDGLADGDEVAIFGSDPLNAHTAGDPAYTDGDYVKGAYDFKTGQKMSSDQIATIAAKMKQFGLHMPTPKTLQDVLVSLYQFSDSTTTPASTTASTTIPSIASSTPAGSPLSGLDTSTTAQEDRDAQRSATIENIGIALIKYQADTKSYPDTSDFTEMYNEVKPYIKVATRPDDPVNKDPYVYSYQVSSDGSDFTLSFYSEVAGQIIKKHAADAQKDLTDQQSSIYDEQRKTDLQMLQTALLLYSNKNVAGNQNYVFPPQNKYKVELVPNYIPEIPKDPRTGADYQYQVSGTFDTFTLKAVLDNPAPGTTGYLCNQDNCQNY